jgi:hypothetical protein
MPHPERRCDVDETYAQPFLARLEAVHPEYPVTRTSNFGETSRRCYLGPHKVLNEKGIEAVKLKSSRGEKESYIDYGCISALGDK